MKLLVASALLITTTVTRAGLLDDVRQRQAALTPGPFALGASTPFDAGLLANARPIESEAERFATLIASADNVRIRSDGTRAQSERVIRDRDWIAQVSGALRSAVMAPPEHCLCLGYTVACFYQGERLVATLTTIHGNQLRMSDGLNGGDYRIDEAHWKLIDGVLKPQFAAVAGAAPEHKPAK